MKYYIWTEGCQMNVADSQRVSAALEQLEYQRAARAEEADIIVLNTCVVRKSAEDKAYNRLMSLRPLKKSNPDLVINLMGCMVGVRDHAGLKKKLPFVDVFSAPSDPVPLVNHLLQREGRAADDVETALRYARMDEGFDLPAHERGNLVSAFVPVVLGCSYACTYCIIPYQRGAEESRPPQMILNEAVSLAAQGVREITLLGQIVDRYGLDKPGYPTLADLLRQMQEIEGLARIRFLTSHPNWMTDELLDCVADLSKVMPHVEVPVQAGDDDVLADMRRGYTASDYRRLIERIRARLPEAAIATDVIVGFPGETDARFQRTYDLLADLKMDVAHLARYSPRPGTVSERRMGDDVPDEEKWRRFRLLEELQEGIGAGINQRHLGQNVEVLFETKVKQRWRGRTPTNKLVFVEDDADLTGQILKVKINWTGPWSMIGELSKT
jgi:tRNA-2-methylthio-N6-dimethylallyladenosine synthase